MRKGLFFKIAATNLKKNKSTYLPFILTCVGAFALYYILGSLAVSESISKLYGGNMLQSVLGFGKWIIGIFSTIFLFYTNSFLLKRRKKEFGLYNILGLEKKHISAVLFLELLYTGLISIILGIATGILLYKGVFLVLTRIIHIPVILGYEISFAMLGETSILFGLIFLVLFANALRQIHLSQTIELLKGGEVGEKEPKNRWVLFLIGIATMGLGYYLAVAIASPVEAMVAFFGAVILVIIGTYALFTAGSIFVLKLMKKNKCFYYKSRHFTAVSGMLYRMKQNAAGLASIAVMSTGVILTISTTACMYCGISDILKQRYPRDASIDIGISNAEEAQKYEKTVEEILESHGVSMKKKISYRYQTLNLNMDDSNLIFDGSGKQENTAYIKFYFLGLEDYNKCSGEERTLSDGEVLVQKIQESKNVKLKDTLNFQGKPYRIKEEVSGFDTILNNTGWESNIYILIFPDFEDVDPIMEGTYEDWKKGTAVYYCSFDLDADPEIHMAIKDELEERTGVSGVFKEEEKRYYYMIYGGVLFIGIFLGLIFLMATVLIIYYKQVSEGYEDHDRFVIMQKVGMDRQEVKRSINSQIKTVFLLPVAMAGIHMAFAYPMMCRILLLMEITDRNLFTITVLITFFIFLLIYWIVYSLTARTYYRLVRW